MFAVNRGVSLTLTLAMPKGEFAVFADRGGRTDSVRPWGSRELWWASPKSSRRLLLFVYAQALSINCIFSPKHAWGEVQSSLVGGFENNSWIQINWWWRREVIAFIDYLTKINCYMLPLPLLKLMQHCWFIYSFIRQDPSGWLVRCLM